MTAEEAQVKAVRRWGENAYVVGPPPPQQPFVVSCTEPFIFGAGASWEEAFDEAIAFEEARQA
jgi:hypothetical protein